MEPRPDMPPPAPPTSADAPPGSRTPPSAVPTAPAVRPVPAEVTCIRCRYELTGLDPAGNCPECGTEVARSMSEDLLRHADPRWRGRVLMGLALLAWGPWSVLLAVLVSLVSFFVIMALGRIETEWLERVLAVILPVAGGVMILGVIAAAIGGFLLTSLEPRDEGHERLHEPRLVARWGLVVALILPSALAAVSGWAGVLVPESVEFLVLALAVLSGGAALVAFHARFRDLATRVPSPALVLRAERGRAWYRGGTIFMTVLLLLTAATHAAESVSALDVLHTILSVVTGLGACAGFVVVVVAFFRSFGVLDLALSLRTAIAASVRTEPGTAAP